MHETLRVFLDVTDTQLECCAAASATFGIKVSTTTRFRALDHAPAGGENPGTPVQQGIGIAPSSSSAGRASFLT
jgi:hypothetical protein